MRNAVQVCSPHEVLFRAEEYALIRAHSPRQRRLLETAFRAFRAKAAREGWPTFLTLPTLVYGALREDAGAFFPLAVVLSMVFVGIDLHDDLADGDLGDAWEGVPWSETQLTADILLCALAPRALTEISAPPEVLVGMQRTLAAGLLHMSAGQLEDLSPSPRRPAAREAEARAAAKSGQEAAAFACLAALLAEAPDSLVRLYTRLGRAIGTAGQLASDCHDLFQASLSRDLLRGARTWPLALHLERLAGSARTRFLSLLEEARRDPAARSIVRRQLMEAGTLKQCSVIVEIYCARALELLRRARPLEPAGQGLRDLVRSLSIYHIGEVPHEPGIHRKTG
jgi:geranylgeranyl pyrophosphate synthase